MAKAAEPGASEKTLNAVSKQLEEVNKKLQDQLSRDDKLLGFSESSGITGKMARVDRDKAEKEEVKRSKLSTHAAEQTFKVVKHQDEDQHKSEGNLT
ncbi:uncharacterized protein METZ01_LOCUS454752, partial [marine metagenome]